MVNFSHSSSLSLFSFPHASSSTPSGSRSQRHPSVDIVPWIVYEHAAPDASESRSIIAGSSSSDQKVRVVGRGGLGSRPQRSKALSVATAPATALQSPAESRVGRDAVHLQRSTSDPKPIIRVVGRGGFGSKPRKLNSQTSNAFAPSNPVPTPASDSETKAIRVGGRGGAGSRLRTFKPTEPKEKRFKWIEKGKAKLLPSCTPRVPRTPRPPTPESEDDSSIEFAPISQPSKPPARPDLNAVSASDAPSLASASDDYPSTPAATSTVSSDFSSSLHTQSSRRLNKLYRTLGGRFPQDMAFMSIKPPVLEPACLDMNSMIRSPLRLSRRSTPTFHYDAVSTHSRRHSDSFSIQAAGSRRESSFVEAYIDDKYESASFVSASRPVSPMSFFEPPIKPPTQPTIPNDEEENEGPTFFVSYRYPEEPTSSHGERPDTPFSQYSMLPLPPNFLHVVHDLEIEPAKRWSGKWNTDMQHVIASHRQLR